MDRLPRIALVVGAVLLVAGGTAAGVGVYREATYDCDDTLSLTRPGPAEAGQTVAFDDRSTDQPVSPDALLDATVAAVCAPDPPNALLLVGGGTVVALVGAALAVPAAVWQRSGRLRRLLR